MVELGDDPVTTRQSLGKSTRFRIFTRDSFTCRYCGCQPPSVKLVVDHLIPVVEGGGAEDENLITACEACNQGKGSKTLATTAPTDTDGARRAQEHLEQIDAAELAQRAVKAHEAHRQVLINYWCDAFGVKKVSMATVTRLAGLSAEFGADRLLHWIDTAAANVHERDGARYLNGIARNVR